MDAPADEPNGNNTMEFPDVPSDDQHSSNGKSGLDDVNQSSLKRQPNSTDTSDSTSDSQGQTLHTYGSTALARAAGSPSSDDTLKDVNKPTDDKPAGGSGQRSARPLIVKAYYDNDLYTSLPIMPHTTPAKIIAQFKRKMKYDKPIVLFVTSSGWNLFKFL